MIRRMALTLCLLLLAAALPALADPLGQVVHLTVELPAGARFMRLNGEPHLLPAPALVAGGRTMAPVEALAEALGAVYGFDPESGMATLVTPAPEAHRLELQLGSDTARFNGAPLSLGAPPAVVRGHVVAPLRPVAAALGAAVHWDAARQQAVLYFARPYLGLADRQQAQAAGSRAYTALLEGRHAAVPEGLWPPLGYRYTAFRLEGATWLSPGRVQHLVRLAAQRDEVPRALLLDRVVTWVQTAGGWRIEQVREAGRLELAPHRGDHGFLALGRDAWQEPLVSRAQLPGGSAAWAAALDLDGQRAALLTGDALVIAGRDGGVATLADLPLPGRAAAWSPDGRFIAVITGDLLHVWDAAKRQRTLTVPAGRFFWLESGLLRLHLGEGGLTFDPETGKPALWVEP